MSQSSESRVNTTGWQALHPPRVGGTVVSLALSPTFTTDSLVCAGSALALHLSQDGGQTWHTPSSAHFAAPVSDIAFSPDFAQDRTLLVAVLGQGLWQSRDSGVTWQNRLSQPVNAIAFSPNYASDRALMVGTDDCILRSTDGGVRWDRASKGLRDPAVLGLALSPAFAQDQIAFAICHDGLYRSDDGGKTWKPLAKEALAAFTLVSVVLSSDFPTDATLYLATENAGILRSTDGGASWQAMGPAGSDDINVLLLRQGRLLGGASDGNLYRSDDRGETWQTLPVGETSILALAAEGDLLLAGTYDVGLFRSIDGGATWQAANDGLIARNFVGLSVSPAVAADQTLYVVGPGEPVCRSQDDGQTWLSLGLSEENINALALSPTFAQEPIVIAVGEEALFRSTDGGETWQRLPLSGGPFRFAVYSPLLTGGVRLAVARGSELLLSTDHGDSWRSLATPWQRDTVAAAAFSPNYARDRSLLVVTGQVDEEGLFTVGTVWRTVDEGQKWERAGRQRANVAWLALRLPPDYDATVAPHRLFMAWGTQIMRPILTGPRHWTAERLGNAQTVVLDIALSPRFKADRTVYVATNQGIWRSRNEGLTWSEWMAGMSPSPILSLHAVEDVNAGGGHRVYALAVGGIPWLHR